MTNEPTPISTVSEADAALVEAYCVLAFCFNRLRGSARSRDGELCDSIQKARASIEKTRSRIALDELTSDAQEQGLYDV